MKQARLLFVLLIGLGFSVQAQVVPSALDQDPERATYQKAKHKLQQRANPVSLPFFDDFASYQGNPDTRWWLPGGGAFINDRFGKDPISKHVATFDGLKANGMEYTFFGATGSRDTLTSQPVLLNSVSPSDSVYLSFFWQAGGNSFEFPAFGNSHNLRLQFKDNTGNWNLVWTQIGSGTSTPFALKMQAITDPKYFHAGFQFRFISSGEKGMKGIWNLDYVYLAAGQSRNNFSRPDLAISRRLNSLLERYTAMPFDQYFANPGLELNDSSVTTINNLNKTIPTGITWEGRLRNLNTGQTNTYLNGSALILQEARQYKIHGTPTQAVFQNSGGFLAVENKILLQTNEPAGAGTLYNDTITRVTDLHNYYAYDDGTPETGNSLGKTGTRFGAYRIRLNQPDKVKSIRFYLTVNNVVGTAVTFRIWNEANGLPDGNGKHIQSYTYQATSPVNGWVELPLDSAVSVQGTFYVGWGLTASVQNFFNLGYDLNETANDNFLTKDTNFSGNNWVTYNNYPLALKGAFMLRPVMQNSTINALPDEPVPAASQVYPNPSAGAVYFSAAWDKIAVYSLTGTQVFQAKHIMPEQPVQLGHLAKGMYLIRLEKGTTITTKKLILN